MIEKINAIQEFEELIHYTYKEGTFIDLYVEACVNNRLVYKKLTPCRFSYVTCYEQYDVYIDWDIDNDVMQSLGLHGSYNTNYQDMKCTNETLVIEYYNYKITLFPM